MASSILGLNERPCWRYLVSAVRLELTTSGFRRVSPPCPAMPRVAFSTAVLFTSETETPVFLWGRERANAAPQRPVYETLTKLSTLQPCPPPWACKVLCFQCLKTSWVLWSWLGSVAKECHGTITSLPLPRASHWSLVLAFPVVKEDKWLNHGKWKYDSFQAWCSYTAFQASPDRVAQSAALRPLHWKKS